MSKVATIEVTAEAITAFRAMFEANGVAMRPKKVFVFWFDVV